MHNFLVFAAEGPNGPILPADFNEVIWSSLAFLIVVTLIVWKGGPAIKNMWNGRINRISDELSQASDARAAGDAKLGDVQTRIANVEQERTRIRTEAQQTASSLGTQVVERSHKEAEEIRRRAALDVEASKAQAGADLQAEIARLAVEAAEEVVTRNLDESTQRQLIESYIAQVGSNGGPR